MKRANISTQQPSSLYLYLMVLFFAFSPAFAQNDAETISKTREASNAALKAYDHERVLSFLTEDVLTTTGNGTLLAGKEALRNYILAAGDSKMYWIRTSETIKINESRGLAWETGTWKGYDPEKGSNSVIGGNYSAMWTKETGQWLIKSQLFVSLE